MEDTFYTLEEIATITGLSKDHLTDTDGPIARICRTFPDVPLGDRKQGLNREGLQRLNEYLEALEDGTSYEEWAKQATKPSEAVGGLVVVPALQTQIVEADNNVDLSIAQLVALKQQMTTSSEDYGDYYESVGFNLGLQLAGRFGNGLNAGIKKGVTATYEKLKLT